MADTVYVKMPQTDYVAICDAIRDKNGEEDTYTSSEAAEAIAALTTVEDVTIVNCGTSTTVLT